MSVYLSSLIVFLAVVALIPLVSVAARSVGLVDNPDARKVHKGAIPLVGGLVIFPVFMGFSMFNGTSLAEYWTLFVGLAFLLVIGALDDRFQINAWLRFFIQIFVACLIVLDGGVRLEHLDNIFGLGVFELGFMAVPFAIAAVSLLINAVNLMDGVDGLAGSQGAVALFWLIVACGLSGQVESLVLMGPLFAGIVGFLMYNMRYPGHPKAHVFMGDAGSLCLGLVLAWFAISLAKEPTPVLVPISVAWILALPIMDACAQFYRRVREGRHPFSPDRGHFHHHFLDAGFSGGQTSAIILMIALAFGEFGVMAIYFGVPQFVLTILWILLLFSHMFISEKPQRYVRMIKAVRDRLV